jgi:hypothetical protein
MRPLPVIQPKQFRPHALAPNLEDRSGGIPRRYWVLTLELQKAIAIDATRDYAKFA